VTYETYNTIYSVVLSLWIYKTDCFTLYSKLTFTAVSSQFQLHSAVTEAILCVYYKVERSLVERTHRDEQTQTSTPSTAAVLQQPLSPSHAAVIRDYADCSREAGVLLCSFNFSPVIFLLSWVIFVIVSSYSTCFRYNFIVIIVLKS